MPKVLIVDDAKLMRTIIKTTLKGLTDFTFFEAENGNDAVELYKATNPDLVTMDITMDFKNGVEAAAEIKQLDPDAKIIMVTAMGQEKMLKECIAIGVSDFIVKPFDKERIVAAVKNVLKL